MSYTTFLTLPIKNKKAQKFQQHINFLTSIEYTPTYFLYTTIEQFIYDKRNTSKVKMNTPCNNYNHNSLNNIYIS